MVMERSALCVTVVVALEELLFGFGSKSSPVTVAVFVIDATLPTATLMVKVAPAALAKNAIAQLTVP